jgi:flagellar biosynthesis/type III secretory pathway protein FliH
MENVKKAVETILKTVVKVDKALEDKKVSIPEGMGIALSAVPWISVFKNIPVLAEELKDWNEQKTNELVEHFKNNLELRNKATEEVVEQAVEVLLRFVFMVLVKPK